jgi:hypothetical protein
MKTVGLLIIAVALAAQAQYGKLSREGQGYKFVLDTISFIQFKAQSTHDKGKTSQTYFWKFLDAGQYPFWCADSNLNGRTRISGVIVTQDGLMIRKWSDATNEHVQVVTVNWLRSKDPVQQKTCKMWLFTRGGNNVWRMERDPIVTTVKVKDGVYY